MQDDRNTRHERPRKCPSTRRKVRYVFPTLPHPSYRFTRHSISQPTTRWKGSAKDGLSGDGSRERGPTSCSSIRTKLRTVSRSKSVSPLVGMRESCERSAGSRKIMNLISYRGRVHEISCHAFRMRGDSEAPQLAINEPSEFPKGEM